MADHHAFMVVDWHRAHRSLHRHGLFYHPRPFPLTLAHGRFSGLPSLWSPEACFRAQAKLAASDLSRATRKLRLRALQTRLWSPEACFRAQASLALYDVSLDPGSFASEYKQSLCAPNSPLLSSRPLPLAGLSAHSALVHGVRTECSPQISESYKTDSLLPSQPVRATPGSRGRSEAGPGKPTYARCKYPSSSARRDALASCPTD